MNDLNDLYYFAKIVDHGSLSAAAEVLGISKSVLSQHLARLESDLGVRLIQRSTRRLQITDIGQRYYERCRIVATEFENAREVIDESRGVPRGRARVSCTLNLSQVFVSRAIAEFMALYPEFEISLDVSNRDVDVLADGYDLALRVAQQIKSSTLVIRSIAVNRHWLLASPALIESRGKPERPDDLERMPAVGGIFPAEDGARHLWRLIGPRNQKRTIAYRPRLVSEDLLVLRDAALAGCGIVDLPPRIFQREVAEGRLVRLLEQWQLPEVRIFALYPSRRGLPVGVRMLVDHLMTGLQDFLRSIDAAGSSSVLVNNTLSTP